MTGSEEFYELMFVDPDAEHDWWHSQDYDSIARSMARENPTLCRRGLQHLCQRWQPISNEMRDLYRTVRGHEDDIQLSNSVKSTIDLFMADDELPF